MKVKHILFLFFTLSFLWKGEKIAYPASDNFGLGPLEIRDQFPVTLPFLSLTPENTSTLEEGMMFVSYQVALANTFLNSAGDNEQITKDEVNRGLVESDFFSPKTGNPVSGFQTYIDIESYRQVLRFKYGLTDSIEFGFEYALVSFVGGSFDEGAEFVHELVGIDNSSGQGAFRSFAEQNQYDYYVLKDGVFIIDTDKEFDSIDSDPLIKLKWNLSEGSSVFPAITVKLVYKLATAQQTDESQYISSGSADIGSALMLSKAYGDWVVYLGWGGSTLENSGEFTNYIAQRFLALEYRFGENVSFLFETVTHSSIFPRSGSLQGSSAEVQSAYLSNPTDVAVIGYKQWFGDVLFETGFVEDYNQTGNQTDFVVFMELGAQW